MDGLTFFGRLKEIFDLGKAYLSSPGPKYNYLIFRDDSVISSIILSFPVLLVKIVKIVSLK